MLKTHNRPIGVFDSGVGGLSILKELQKILPNENFVFLADQAHVPYGEKSKRQLVVRCSKITDYLIKYHAIKMMVIACNTATCGAVDELRAYYELPIVGTVPAIKPAAGKTKSGTIAVISTPATSKSKALSDIMRNDCGNTEVLNIGCKNLENVVEEGNVESSEVKALLVKYLKAVKNSNADHLVLGCTHYPFLKKAIQKMVGPSVKLLDSGKAIARHTKSLLILNKLKNTNERKGKTLYFTTGQPAKFSQVASLLLKRKVEAKKAKI